MADVPGPDNEEEVEYVEVYEEVTDEEDDAGEVVQQQQGEITPAAAPAVEPPPPAAPADVPAAVPPKPESKDTTAAAATSPGQRSSTSTSTAGEDTFTDVQLPSSPPATAADPAAAAAASSGSLDSQAHLALMEQQASKVAADVAQLASQVTHKLHDGFLQAFSSAAAIATPGDNSRSSGTSQGPSSTITAEQQQQPDTPGSAGAAAAAAATAAAAAAAGLGTKLTGGLSGLSSWWSNLDQSLAANNTPLAESGSSPADKLKKSSSPEAQLSALLGLSPGEALVEAYSCSLVQSYACGHNSLTPPMQITFEGKLYITDKRACFHAAAEQQPPPQAADPGATTSSSSSSSPAEVEAKTKRQGRKKPQLSFNIAHADVAAATREPNPARSSTAGSRSLASDLLQVVVEPKGSGSSSSTGPVRPGASAAGGAAAAAGGGGEGSGRWTVRFQSFEPSSGLDGALALLEHLREG